MKQTAILTAFKKIVIVLGFCLIPSTSPVFAQNNNQATTLLEIQALRQEVAELRDMVERQQYEMRQLKSGLQSSEAKKPSPAAANTAATQSQSNAVANIIGGNTTLAPSSTPSGNTTQVPSSLNYQSGTGRLSVPAPGQSGAAANNALNNAIDQATTSLNNARPTTTIPNTSAPSIPTGNGAIDASNIPTAPSLNGQVQQRSGILSGSQGANSTLGQANAQPTAQPKGSAGLGNTVNGVSRQAERVFSTTGVNPTTNQGVNSAQSNLPGAAGIQPVETIQPGSPFPSANVAQPQQGVTNQVASLNALSENDYYQQGFGLLKESKHDEAVTVFQQQIKQYPQGDLADDAYYWVAESLYVTRQLDASKESFRAIIQGYPKSERAADAMLKLAYIEQEQGNIIESRILLQEIIQFHPQSDAALSAKNRLSQIN